MRLIDKIRSPCNHSVVKIYHLLTVNKVILDHYNTVYIELMNEEHTAYRLAQNKSSIHRTCYVIIAWIWHSFTFLTHTRTATFKYSRRIYVWIRIARIPSSESTCWIGWLYKWWWSYVVYYRATFHFAPYCSKHSH